MREDVAAILFDEPLTVIDPHLKWQLRCKLKEIHEQLKLTLIYVTHDQVEALTFAEKVIVMYEGGIVQIGTPHELFENPSHKFVGYFIGSPGMNFLPCKIDGNKAFINGSAIEIDDKIAALGEKLNNNLELGIRPLYLQVHVKAVENSVPVTVKSIEDHGSYKIVTVRLAGNLLRARLPEGSPSPSEKAWLRFPKDWIRLFHNDKLLTRQS